MGNFFASILLSLLSLLPISPDGRKAVDSVVVKGDLHGGFTQIHYIDKNDVPVKTKGYQYMKKGKFPNQWVYTDIDWIEKEGILEGVGKHKVPRDSLDAQDNFKMMFWQRGEDLDTLHFLGAYQSYENNSNFYMVFRDHDFINAQGIFKGRDFYLERNGDNQQHEFNVSGEYPAFEDLSLRFSFGVKTTRFNNPKELDNLLMRAEIGWAGHYFYGIDGQMLLYRINVECTPAMNLEDNRVRYATWILF